MITALVKHRQTAQNRQMRANQPLPYQYTYICRYTHCWQPHQKLHSSLFFLWCSGCCFKSEIDFSAQRREVTRKRLEKLKNYQHYEALSVLWWPVRVRCLGSSALTELLGKCLDQSIQSAGIERHLVTEPGHVLENLQFHLTHSFHLSEQQGHYVFLTKCTSDNFSCDCKVKRRRRVLYADWESPGSTSQFLLDVIKIH